MPAHPGLNPDYAASNFFTPSASIYGSSTRRDWEPRELLRRASEPVGVFEFARMHGLAGDEQHRARRYRLDVRASIEVREVYVTAQYWVRCQSAQAIAASRALGSSRLWSDRFAVATGKDPKKHEWLDIDHNDQYNPYGHQNPRCAELL